MKSIINFFKRKPYGLFSAYWFIQIIWYQVLMRLPNYSDRSIRIPFNSVDELIPFCEIFIIFYVLWYPFILYTNVFILRNGTKSEFMYLSLMTVIGMVICMAGNTLFPTELIRDEALLENLGRSNILTRLTQVIYAADSPPRIVFPSMHVYGSLVLGGAMLRCKSASVTLKIIAGALSVLICLSTVFVKQHSVIDLVAGVLLFIILHFIYVAVLRLKRK